MMPFDLQTVLHATMHNATTAAEDDCTKGSPGKVMVEQFMETQSSISRTHLQSMPSGICIYPLDWSCPFLFC